jgi:hypothetical protein
MALDVVQSLVAAIGNLTAIKRSTLISTRKNPDSIAHTLAKYVWYLQGEIVAEYVQIRIRI